MWALLFVFISYGSLYIITAIVYHMWGSSQDINRTVVLFEATLTINVLRGMMITASEVVIMYLSQTFISLETNKNYTTKLSPRRSAITN